MERKRKGYLLRKSDAQRKQQPSNSPPSNGHQVCNGNSPACRTYDLQTQTVTFGDESDLSMQEEDSSHKMECDGLEFYPVADAPSPCTFSAWDAFLSGSCQAFFREPFMAAIPEEEEEGEVLYGSDTDDTGSSVSTVVDRFGGLAAPCEFDLEKVLSPFERLEKELDAHQGSKEDQKDILPRGPIVVITNSSSCEDVHSEPDDPKTNGVDPLPAETTHQLPPVPSRSKAISGQRTKQEGQAIPEKPSSEKPEKKSKKVKSEKIASPNGSSKKSRPSYPTPSVPPRMSTHLPARRTRSDPGSPDTPSRIPRPIAKVQGSPKGAAKVPKKGSPVKKALSFERSSSRSGKASVENASLPESSGKIEEKSEVVAKETLDDANQCCENGPTDSSASNAIGEDSTPIAISTKEMDESDENLVLIDVNQTDLPPIELSETDSKLKNSITIESVEEDSVKRALDTSVSESDSVFECSLQEGEKITTETPSSEAEVNEEYNPEAINANSVCENVERHSEDEGCLTECDVKKESTPALHPKAQIAAAINPPPIPERPSLLKNPTTADHTAPSAEPSFWPSSSSRPIEDILDALDQLVAPSQWAHDSLLSASDQGSGEDGLDVEDLLREVQKTFAAATASPNGEEASPEIVRTPPLGPGTPDVPTAGTTANHDNLPHQQHNLSSDHPSPDMLRHAHHLFSSPLMDDPKHPQHSPGCDDSGVFLEEPHSEDDPGLASSSVDSADDLEPPPVTRKPPPIPARRRGTKGSSDSDSTFGEGDDLDQPPRGGKYSNSEDESREIEYLKDQSKYSIHEGSKENGYKTKIHSAYSFEEDSVHRDIRNQSNYSVQLENGVNMKNQSIKSVEEIRGKYPLEKGNLIPGDIELSAKNLSKLESSNQNGYHTKARSKYPIEDDEKSDFEADTRLFGDIPVKMETKKFLDKENPNENGYQHLKNNFTKLLIEDDLGKNATFREDFTIDDIPLNKKNALQPKISNSSGYSSSKFSIEDLSKDVPVRASKNRLEDIYSSKFSCEDLRKDSQSKFSKNKLEVPSSQPNSLKWKSEECLRTAGESKWTVRPRFGEKGVSVKDRIAMFSTMETSSSSQPAKKDLQRYGSENNIKSMSSSENTPKKFDVSPLMEETNDMKSLNRESKWQSMQNIDKKKDTPCYSSPSTIKPALSIPSLLDNNTNNSPNVFPVKSEVDTPKPIVSSYPETQLTTNSKRYNYGLYSLKSLKQTEDLLSKKAAGATSMLSSIINKPPLAGKLKGLIIPDRPTDAPPKSTVPPTILSNDSTDAARRASLPVTIVTACNSRSKLVEPPWKTSTSVSSSNTLPRYGTGSNSYRRGQDGGSLSPASPLSSPSSVSSVQQNVFQFSLSHSKPVKPLKPEKALMSPPSEVESVMPKMAPKEEPEPPPRPASPPPRTAPIAFKSTSTKSSTLQPLLVEDLVKPSDPGPPMAAVCISKTEIHLRDSSKAEPKSSQTILQQTSIGDAHTPNGRLDKLLYSSKSVDYIECSSKSYHDLPSDTPSGEGCHGRLDKLMYSKSMDYTDASSKSVYQEANKSFEIQQPITAAYTNGNRVPEPLTLNGNEDQLFIEKSSMKPEEKSAYSKTNGEDKSKSKYQESDLFRSDKSTLETDDRWSGRFRASPLQLGRDRRPLMTPSECDDSDECLSDGLDPRRPFDDSASTEGYLSDASTDVSLRRFATTRPAVDAYSASEEYLSDATAPESPDPEWVSSGRATVGNGGETIYRNRGEDSDLDLMRPRRLSQQRTVLKASSAAAKPTSAGSVQKFRALAEQWEQRVISPPPALPILPLKANTLPSKGLPPSLMPRTTRSHRDNDTWSQSSEELVRGSRSDSTSSDSSKTTVKEEDGDHKELNNGHATVPKASWHNEPRNRRGVDFTWSTSRPKTSVSDIRRSFEKDTTAPPQPVVVVSPAAVSAVATMHAPLPVTTAATSPECLESGLRLLREEGLDGGQLEVLSVSLRREDGIDGGSVGITLAGGADYEVKEITVHKVISGSLADRDGRVRKGDRVLSINGRPLRGVSHGEALHTLKTPGPIVTLVIARPSSQQLSDANTVVKARPSAVIEGDMVLVDLQKDATGLGFSIEGGKDSPQGDRPLLIKRVFKGGAADKDGQLCEGDVIVAVNGHPMANMTRTEAWNYLKKLPEGPVTLQLRKGTPS